MIDYLIVGSGFGISFAEIALHNGKIYYGFR
jgi:hypothetical protein